MANPYLLLGMQLSPLSMERLVRMIPPSRYDEKTDPLRFTVREAMAHMADWEPVLLDRMQTTISNPGATIKAWDESKRALDNNYAATDPLAEVQRLIDMREVTVRFIRERAEGHWDNHVIHPERGPMTLADQANAILGHDHYHIEHLTQYLV